LVILRERSELAETPTDITLEAGDGNARSVPK